MNRLQEIGSCTLAQLIESIRKVAHGKCVMDLNFSIKNFFDEQPDSLSDIAEPFIRDEVLTLREKEVLSLLSDGLTNKQIASKLHLSIRTVEMHLHNSYAKLNVQSRLQAVVKFNYLAKKREEVVAGRQG